VKSNEYQIGGMHYQHSYQHWDWCIDNQIPYLYGCATKYATRWRDKNGADDLRKCAHYVSKIEETVRHQNWRKRMLLKVCAPRQLSMAEIKSFTKQLYSDDAALVQCIMLNDFVGAHYWLAKLLEEAETQPSRNYINPDI
jgi:hypothetical protein